MVYIENEELLKDSVHKKKLISAMNRIEKASKEIGELGYVIYVSAHGSLNVMNTEVGYIHDLDFHEGQLVATGNMYKTDCGDW